MHYQPKFDAQACLPIGAEALLRWEHPQHGLLLPDRFIDHDTPVKQYDEAGLNAPQIVAMALSALGQSSLGRPAADLPARA